MTALIELREVSKVFRSGRLLMHGESTVAVDGVSLSLAAGEPSITAIAGESGSGKTTLARILLGVMEPSAGEIFFEGRSLASMSRLERFEFQRSVQPIFQDAFDVFNPFYRIDHVLMLPIRKFGLARSRDEARRLVGDALERVGLRPTETLGRYPHELSGGQRQRIMVARALLLRPKLIIADEPVSMVDASLRATILESLVSLKEDFGISIVYITHDLTTAYQISENIMVMYHGTVVEAGGVDNVIGQPQHPYTQLLVSSIPQPDPRIRWGEESLIEGSPDDAETGCPFAPRCPHRMAICVEASPPLFRTEEIRAVACYLHRDSPPLGERDIASVFVKGGRATIEGPV